MMFRFFKVVMPAVAILLLSLSAGYASAQAQTDSGQPTLDQVKQAFEQRFPGIQVDNVRLTPLAELYEVQVGMELLYVDKEVSHVLQGALIDAKTRTDLTAQHLQKLAEVPFDTLPLDLAVKQVKGDGSRKIAVFEDPNCIYCKQLHANLKEIDNYTMYTFIMPILSPDSVTKAQNVWCSDNPAKAWKAWMTEGTPPPSAQCDNIPTEQVLALGQRLMVRGTPAILFADGSRVNGVLPSDQLKAKLDTLN